MTLFSAQAFAGLSSAPRGRSLCAWSRAVEAQAAPSLAAAECAGDMTDIQAALGGDGDAYARLVGRYQQQIASRMRWFSRQSAVAEEMVQDVFVEAYISLRGYRGQAPFAHWLQKIATRVGYRHWKAQARERRRGIIRLEGHLNGLGATDDCSEAAMAGDTVHTLLARLGPRDRLVLTLLYLEGRSVAEAAVLAGWSLPMIKVQAFRARGKLKRLLAEMDR
jgi:RNA polymerase sigma-70 factor (ECF subfamily)